MANPAALPKPAEDLDGDGRWHSVHERYVTDTKCKEPDVLFLGDSHIQLLEQSEVYKEIFAPLHCLCFGMRGDTTANLLWRLENGELENIKPKAIILLIGSNNRESAEQVLEGIKCIVACIKAKQPQASLFVLKIPPRGEKPNKKRDLITAINNGLAHTLSEFANCHVLDVDPGFVAVDGSIDHHDMYDYLHFTNDGYRKAFEMVYVALQTFLVTDEMGIMIVAKRHSL